MELLLKTEPDQEKSLHRTVVPLFTDVAGTVRLDCTVPEDELTWSEVIPRLEMTGLVDANPSTSHVITTPVPAQWNWASVPITTDTDTGPSVITGNKINLKIISSDTITVHLPTCSIADGVINTQHGDRSVQIKRETRHVLDTNI